MKFLLISPKNRTVWNFRGDLIREIIARGYEVVVTGPDQTDVDRITALGARFVEVPMNKTGTSILGDLRYCHTLTELFRNERPDVTLGYTVKPCIYGAIAAKKAGVPNIACMITGAGYTFTATTWKARILGGIVRMLYRKGLKNADHVIFQNPDDMREFCERGLVQPDKCFVVHGSGVNLEHFQPAPFPKQLTFLMISRLLKSKGVAEYLEAARIVKQKHPEVRFCLLGKFETQMQDALPREYVQPFIDDGIVERFEETSDVRPYYAQCSVYVLPSYREGTPRTVLEAMAMGRPIITTDTQGCRETVKNGENGFLIPVKSIQPLAAKMESFIKNQKQITLMGNKSRVLAKDIFNVQNVNQEICSALEL